MSPVPEPAGTEEICTMKGVSWLTLAGAVMTREVGAALEVTGVGVGVGVGVVLGWTLTVTVKDPVAVFPAPSVADAWTVVLPTGKVLPEAGTSVTGTLPLTRSVAEAENVTTAPEGAVASTVKLPGRASTGGVVSRTVTVKVPVVVPAASVDDA